MFYRYPDRTELLDIYYSIFDVFMPECGDIIDRQKMVSALDPMRRFLLIGDDGNKVIRCGEVEESDKRGSSTV